MLKKLITSSLLIVAGFAFIANSANAYDAELNALLFESSELMQQGKVDEALLLLKNRESQFETSREFMNNLAVAYLGNSQPDMALAILRQLVDNDPLYSIITHNLLEMELQITDAREDKIKPVLFIQTVESFFDEEIANIQTNQPNTNQSSASQPVVAEPLPNKDSGITVLADRRSMAQDLVLIWSSYWSSKNYNDYISLYSKQFIGPNGESYQAWSTLRQSRLDKPGEISVRPSNIQVEDLGETRVRVTFDQRYSSSNYSDLVLKELILSAENSGWKIIRESTLATY